MTYTNKRDAIEAAMSIADKVAQGRLAPADMEALAVRELTELFAEVVPGSPVWPLQVAVARGVLAAGGIPADELAEWTAVQRASEKPEEPAKPLSVPEPVDPDQAAPEPVSFASEELSPENDALDTDPETEPAAPAETEPVAPVAVAPVTQLPPPPQRRSDRYDPLAGSVLGRGGFLS
jgi:hypothetical protein